MDAWTRMILASLLGVGAGLAISYFFGNAVFWVVVGLAAALATETSLRTIKNVKGPANPVLDSQQSVVNQKIRPPKPPQAKF